MPSPITFTLGWELEACRAARIVPSEVLREHDGSVSGDGTEYKIAPEFVTDPAVSLLALRALTSDANLHVNRTCGFHVHVGINGRPRPGVLKQWASAFVLLARRVEPYAFMAVPPSRRTNSYCRAWRQDNGSVIVRRYSGHKYSNDSRYQWVNVVEMFRPGGIRTVEIRLLGSTKRYPYLFAWASICHLMAQAAWRLIGDPSALEHEAEVLRTHFQNLAQDVLTIRNAHRAAETAALIGMSAGLIRRDQMAETVSAFETMGRLTRPDPSETAETRFTEAQAWVEMGRIEDPAEAFLEARREATERFAIEHGHVERPPRPRRSRLPRASEPGTLAEHMQAAAAVRVSVDPGYPAGFNPDAFVVVPSNNGGSI